MGNHCCVLPSPQGRSMNKDDPYGQSGEGNGNFELPHISEREDLSNHKGTLFLTRSLSNPGNNGPIPNGHRTLSTIPDNRGRTQTDGPHLPNGNLTKKFSSCSTIFIDDSTVSQPNLKSTIKCVALAVYYHVKHRDNEIRALDIFDERLHPLTHDPVADTYDRVDPEQRHVYKFIKTLFHAAQLTAECAIITLVYLERLLTYAEIDIYPGNWKRILLGAILLASKVWDDQAVWNVDYCQILKDVTVEDMNELERAFLELLQFNVSVPSSVYAKYYFDLRSLADANDLILPVQPLSKRRARKLEALSCVNDDTREVPVPERPRSRSVDTSALASRGMAILS